MHRVVPLLWLVGLTLLWPGLHLGIFALRFGRLPPEGIAEAVPFLVMGLVSAAAFLWLWGRAESPGQRRAIAFGYALASPLAFIGSLLGGLMLPPIVGALLFGALPLIGGMLFGASIERQRLA